MYIGLPDTIANRKAASMQASQIELDRARYDTFHKRKIKAD
ncbi:hypothetical protein QUB33_22275 [Microcoleus sp. B3-A4]